MLKIIIPNIFSLMKTLEVLEIDATHLRLLEDGNPFEKIGSNGERSPS